MDKGEELANDFDTAMANKDWHKAQYLMNQLWLDTMVYLTQLTNPELKELNYIKVNIETDTGSYLLSLLHVDGEKIKFGE